MPWKQAVWIGSAVAMVGLVAYLRVFKPAWQRSYSWKVTEVRKERGQTHTLVVEPVGHEGMRFNPGQFAWIKLDLRTMADRRDPRPVLLIYAEKALDGVPYLEALDELSQRLDLRIVRVLEDPPPDWADESGFVDGDLLDRRLPQEEFPRQFFVCGPPPMMDSVHAALLERGVPEAKIQMEKFVLA